MYARPGHRLLRRGVVGPIFHFDLPAHGLLTVGIRVPHEWNHNGLSDCPSACFVHSAPIGFDVVPEVELV